MILYKEVRLFLDNDEGGDTATGLMKGMGLALCLDMRENYRTSNDVNTFLVSRIEEKQKNQSLINSQSISFNRNQTNSMGFGM
jgi:hypothetical protein